MEIKISVKSYEQLEKFREAYFKETGTWLKDYDEIINVMFKLLDFYVENGYL
jgi:hypothetical protein